MLTAVCLDIRGDVITLAATDRYRLAVRDLNWAPAEPAGSGRSPWCPARTLADAARVMVPGVPVSVSFAAPEEPGTARRGDPRPVEGMISFDSGGRRLTGRLIAGEFIRYESRFPAEYGCRAEMPAASLIEAVRRVSLVADRASPVRLTFGSGHRGPGGPDRGPGPGGRTGHRELPRRRAGDRLQPALPARRAHRRGGRIRARPAPCPHGRPRRPATGPPLAMATGDRPRTAPADRRPSGWSSPARPRAALITLAGDDGDGPEDPGDGDTTADGAATGPQPAFRYLVVPLRSPARG